MKNLDNDILKNTPKLKENAYRVPEGYFDDLKAELKMIPQSKSERKAKPMWKWLSAAAAIVLAAGGYFLTSPAEDAAFTEEDYIASSEEMTNILMQEYYGQENPTGLTEDDIIEYLIFTGTEIEYLENQ